MPSEPKPCRARVHERLPVGDQAEGLAHERVVERGPVDSHQEDLDRRARCGDDLDLARVLLRPRLRERQLAHHVDLAGEQRVDPRGLVVDRDVLPLVDVGLALVPVVLVADAEAALTDGELLELEGARADGVRVVGHSVLHDDRVLLDERVDQPRVRALQRHDEREVVGLAELGDADVGHARVRDVRLVAHQLHRVDDVVGGERLAVVPHDVRPQLDLPLRRVGVRRPLEREGGRVGKVRVHAGQRVVDVVEARGVDERRPDRGVEALRVASADMPDAQTAAGLDVAGRRSGRSGRLGRSTGFRRRRRLGGRRGGRLGRRRSSLLVPAARGQNAREACRDAGCAGAPEDVATGVLPFEDPDLLPLLRR